MDVEINGKICTFEPGEYIIDVAARNGFEIPTLCHHEGLRGQGCCRVCLVELNGKIVPACVTKLEKPSVIQTNSGRVVQERGVILALLKHRAPNSPEIDAMAKKYGAPELRRLRQVADADRCIMCGLCVRACRAMGTGAIATILRGTQKRVDTPYGDASAACIGCGSCASVCPTNSIFVEDKEGKRTIWNRTFDLVYCERCGALLGTRESLIYAGRPSENLCENCRSLAASQQVCAMLHEI